MTANKRVPHVLHGLAILTGAVVFGLAAPAAAGGAWFAEDDPQFEPGACGGTNGCFTNYLRVSDLDADGDLDAIFVNYDGFFENGSPEPLAIYENDGTGAFSNVSGVAIDDYSGRIRQVAIGDVDGDGDPDIYVPDASGSGSAFFINEGGMTFVDEYSDRMPGTEPRAGAARFFDADNDGDLDLFAADGFIAGGGANVFGHIYLNDGSGSFTELDAAIPGGFGGEDIDDVDVFDADRDFDLDIMVNAHAGSNALWLNDGSGSFTDASDQLPNQPGGFHYGPSVCDVNGDGALDIWIDNMGPGYNEQLLINDGTGTFTDESAMRVTGNNAGDDDNGVRCADIYNDGDFDAIVISLSSPERFLQNDGNGNFTAVGGVFPGPTDTSLWGEFGDVDGDGRIDLVTGQGEGDTENKLYRANGMVPVDDREPTITAFEQISESDDGSDVFRFAVSDRSVEDDGPRLRRAFARVAFTAAHGVGEVDATFSGGDLYRVEVDAPAVGEIEVELCAEDQAGNVGCAEAFTYMVTDVAETEGSTGTDGDTDDSDSVGPTGGPDTDSGPDTDGPGTTTTDSTSASGTTAGSSGVSASASGSGTDGDTDTDGAGANEDSGCGCTTGDTDGSTVFGFGALLLLGLGRRRRG